MDENIKAAYITLGGDERFGSIDNFYEGLKEERNRRAAFKLLGGTDRFHSFDEFQIGLGFEPDQGVVLEPTPEEEEENIASDPLKTLGRAAKTAIIDPLTRLMYSIQESPPMAARGLVQPLAHAEKAGFKGIEKVAEFLGVEEDHPIVQAAKLGQIRAEEVSKDALRDGLKASRKRQARREGMVTSYTQLDLTPDSVQDVADIASYVFGFMGDALPQIAISWLTGGAGAFGQIADEVYGGAVMAKAEALGITPEEVIEQGLDNDAALLAGSALGGALEFAGAKGVGTAVAKEFTEEGTKGLLRKSFAKKYLLGESPKEGLTELAQYGIETITSAYESGQDVEFDKDEAIDSFVGGYFGSRGMQILAKQASKLKPKKDETTTEPDTGQDRGAEEVPPVTDTTEEVGTEPVVPGDTDVDVEAVEETGEQDIDRPVPDTTTETVDVAREGRDETTTGKIEYINEEDLIDTEQVDEKGNRLGDRTVDEFIAFDEANGNKRKFENVDIKSAQEAIQEEQDKLRELENCLKS